MARKLWYNLDMPPTFEKKELPITMKVSASLRLRLEEIAARDDRPLGYVARELMLRGLHLFEKDGSVRDESADVAKERIKRENAALAEAIQKSKPMRAVRAKTIATDEERKTGTD